MEGNGRDSRSIARGAGEERLERCPKKLFVVAAPSFVQRQGILPFHRFRLVGIAMRDLAVGIFGEQVVLPVPDEAIERLHVGWAHDTPRSLVDENRRRKHRRNLLSAWSRSESVFPPPQGCEPGTSGALV